MILSLKIKSNNSTKKKQIYIWIQREKQLKEDINQIIKFFKNQINLKKRVRFHKYYKITSKSPAIMLSILTTIQELIPEIYFPANDIIDLEDLPQI